MYIIRRTVIGGKMIFRREFAYMWQNLKYISTPCLLDFNLSEEITDKKVLGTLYCPAADDCPLPVP